MPHLHHLSRGPDCRRVRPDGDEAVFNTLIGALSPKAGRELLAMAERVPLSRRQVIQERNLPLRHAYFIESGVASLFARAGNRSVIEIGTVGVRDVIGISLILGTGRSPHRCVVQIPGHAFRIAAEQFRFAMETMPELRRILLAYVQSALVHSAQLVACNTRHGLHERVARWLLVAMDQLQSPKIALTHDCMSRALGVRRASITITTAHMEEQGLIQRGRGEIVIVDRKGLEGASCCCYRAITAGACQGPGPTTE